MEKLVIVCGSPEIITFFDFSTFSYNLLKSAKVKVFKFPSLRRAVIGPDTEGRANLLKFFEA